MKTIKTLAVAKFGGSLLTEKGEKIPVILDAIKSLKNQNGVGPIVVFSAPNGFTDKLIKIGESYTGSEPLNIDSIFAVYQNLAKKYVKGKYLNQALAELENYQKEMANSVTLITNGSMEP